VAKTHPKESKSISKHRKMYLLITKKHLKTGNLIKKRDKADSIAVTNDLLSQPPVLQITQMKSKEKDE
jgi:hypothetical protein